MEICEVTPERLDDLADLFDSNGATRGCWCMYFLIPRKEYGEGRRGGNEQSFRELTEEGGQPLGLIAYRDAVPVGWVAAGPRSRYRTAIGPRATVMKGRDPAEDDDVWLIPCFFVRVGARRSGTTRELLQAAVDFALRSGAKAVEGFPLSEEGTQSADGYLGREHVFTDCGFSVIRRPSDRRVVVRKDLES